MGRIACIKAGLQMGRYTVESDSTQILLPRTCKYVIFHPDVAKREIQRDRHHRVACLMVRGRFPHIRLLWFKH